MENHKLVLPEHLNHHGYLYGGYLLKWVDENAWIAATLEYKDCKFVTIAMDKVEFKRSVRQGSILRFSVEKVKKGNTSVTYQVDVYKGNDPSNEKKQIFTTRVTLVNVDKNCNKSPLSD